MFVKSLVALALVSLVSSSAVPITKCKPDDFKCFKQNTVVLVPLFAAGIPELGIEQLDPVTFKKIDSTSDLLKLIFTDATLTGLKTCRFKNIKHDTDKQTISAKIYCDVTLDGQYEMNGRILTLIMHGKGKAHIEHEKVEITLEMQYKEGTGADGKKHWIIGDWKHDFDYKGKTTMEFENLLEGNEILSRVARDLIRDRPNEMAKLTAGPVIKTITSKIIENLKIFFEKIPVEDFALE